MAEKLTMDRLELLLEEMEPSEIRTLHSDELAADPKLEAFLASFEDLDSQLANLKTLEPPPAFRRRPRTILAWALPLAAALVLGLLWITRIPQMNETPFADERAVAATESPVMEVLDDSDAAALELREEEQPTAARPEPLERAARSKATEKPARDLGRARSGSGQNAGLKMVVSDTPSEPEAFKDDASDEIVTDTLEAPAVSAVEEALTVAATPPTEKKETEISNFAENLEFEADYSFSEAPAQLRQKTTDTTASDAAVTEMRQANARNAVPESEKKKRIVAKNGSQLPLWWQDFHEAWIAEKPIPEDMFAPHAAYQSGYAQNFAYVSWDQFINGLRQDQVRFTDVVYSENKITTTLIRNGRSSKLVFGIYKGKCIRLSEYPEGQQ